MKKIQVSRKIYTDLSTIGDIFFDGNFICSSLEDTIRNVKLAKQTAIPAGEYKIEIRHSPKFNRMMPFLLDVPFFEGIMFHWGNDPKDTDGCILTGHYDTANPDWISSSRKSFDQLMTLILEAHAKGEDIIVNVFGGLRKEEFIAAKQA